MKPLRGLAILAVLAATLAAGIWLGANPEHLPAGVRDVFVKGTGGLTAEAADLIEGHYFREVSQTELDDGSINGMVRAISKKHRDRFSHYFDPEAVERFDQAISGSFTGVGLTVTGVPRGLRVARVIPGAPAAGAGIKTGDVIVSVDGESIAGKSVEEATAEIKGPEGSEVELGIDPAAGGKVRTVKITRAEVQLPPTRATMRERDGHKIGYLQFATFSRDAHSYVRRAVERLRRKGAEGILLDLRGNGGGLLTEAILTASVFIPEGEVVVTTRSRSEGEAIYEATGGSLEPGPLVVLINRDTASAAEILAAALSTDLKAPLVGTRTYGKGVFQKLFDLANGGALDLTIGEYYTADGVSLAGKGLQPDIKVSDNPETPRDEAFQRGIQVLLDEIDTSS
jgi:carboxyl-terminal processing protease